MYTNQSGDYKMDEGFITKQILPNKLRLVMAPRTGEEPDPPQVDFSSNGKGIIDMTNIDFKFPSEHTVCGKRFDGEMQYWVYHPSRLRFVAVSFFLEGKFECFTAVVEQKSPSIKECLLKWSVLTLSHSYIYSMTKASPTNPQNEHLQEVINAFREVSDEDKNKCELKKKMSNAHSFAKPNNRNRMLHAEGNHTLGASTVNGFWGDEAISAEIQHALNTSILENNEGGSLRRRLALKWHPFHPDIQKSVHFWGYSGSFTEPPCTSNSVSWKIMDVPTPISEKQLLQFKQILFNHVDEDCRKTSVHNADGSVARPTQSSSKYYKCTRDNYVSDEERAICGDRGCNRPFGEGLNTYYPPLVDVTGPPTRSPTT